MAGIAGIPEQPTNYAAKCDAITLLNSIIECCDTKLCRISSVPRLACLSLSALANALRSLSHDGFILILGDLRLSGYIWITAKGYAEGAATLRPPR